MARGAFAIFQDMCVLGNGEHPQYLRLEYLHTKFSVELIEGVLTSYNKSSARRVSLQFISMLAALILPSFLNILSSCSDYITISPLLLRTLSERSAFPFPLTPCGTRNIFILLKQSWLNLRQTPRSFSRRSPNSSVVRRSR